MVLISVIIPTYNRAKMLPRAIESVIQQTLKEWELIIIDDGSTDNTKSVVDEFLSDKRISYLYQENRGVSAARNLGTEKAIGNFFCFLDSDDWVKKEWLDDFFQKYCSNKQLEVIIGGFCVSKDNRIVKNRRAEAEKYNNTLPGTYFIKSALFKEIGGFDTHLSYGENTELFFRVYQQSPKVGYLKKENLIYNKSNSGGSMDLGNQVKSLKHILKKHEDLLDANVKFLYLQIIGVSLMKTGDLQDSKYYLGKAYLLKPWKIKTLLRFLISLSPFLIRRIYQK
ncbi:glycosyltransferase family A protein [Echinicola rosea]|uniref:Glycosyl transferase n=1 Tax=Echinicola rosea TaxID=1807691 RepID=A0ABQ1V9N5_9BACT|nr:glycosyltransferase family A protein [Echinicola rosea]GGF46955.1 glycosyl transferase [Echinicola rosea]